jgi:hypothetical protein
MPHSHEWQARLKAVELEYLAIRRATDRFKEQARRDPTILKKDLRYRNIDLASDNLESTYLIRLFAEFETGLMSYWARASRRSTNPRTRDLLERIAAKQGIPDEQRENAHAVREYRNSLLHERGEEAEPVPIDQAGGYLRRFFSFLPSQW